MEAMGVQSCMVTLTRLPNEDDDEIDDIDEIAQEHNYSKASFMSSVNPREFITRQLVVWSEECNFKQMDVVVDDDPCHNEIMEELITDVEFDVYASTEDREEKELAAGNVDLNYPCRSVCKYKFKQSHRI